MQFGFSLNAFRGHSLANSVEALADIGFDGVEVLLDEPHLVPGEATPAEERRIRETIESLDLVVCNCNAFMLHAINVTAADIDGTFSIDWQDFHFPSFVDPDPAHREARIEHTKRALRTAHSIGAPHISITPGGPVIAEMDNDQATDYFVEGLREVMPVAEEVGVEVLIEPEPHLLIERSDEFLAVADRVNADLLGCNFDAGHFYCAGEDPAELVPKLASLSPHYHIEDIPDDRRHEHVQLGTGSMDINGFLTAVEATGYDGFVTVELYPYDETPVESARDAMAYLKEHGWA